MKEVPDFSTWRLGWRLMRSDPKGFALSLALWTGWNVWFLPIGLAARSALDRISGGPAAADTVWIPLAILMGTELLRATDFWFACVVWTRVFYTYVTLLRTNLLSRVVRGPGRTKLPDSPGEAVSRFRDDSEEYVNFLDIWIDVTASAVFSVAALVIMVRVSPILTLAALVPMVGTIVLMQLMSPRIREYRRASRRTTSAVTGFVGEIFGAVQAVKVADATEGVLRRFASLNEARRKAAVRDRLVVEGTDAAVENLVHVATGLVLLLSARAMRAGSFSVGDFALFTTYIWWLTRLPRWTGYLMARSKQSAVNMGRMARVLDGAPADILVEHNPTFVRGPEPEVPHTPKTDAHRLEELVVSGLTYAHPDTGRGITDVGFRIRRGEFVVVTGRIGSGKTTLLRALLGLCGPATGEIRWNGELVDDPMSFFVPPRSAYTPQVPRLFSETLRDNVLMGLPPRAVDTGRALHRAVFVDDLAHMPEGLETVVGPRGVRLSGGQIQRAAAARMFVRDAELLVFDDLSSALDVETEARLWERVFADGDATCLVVSHRRAALRRADRIVVMDGGRVADTGPLDDLLGRCDEMRRLWSSRLDPATQPERTSM